MDSDDIFIYKILNTIVYSNMGICYSESYTQLPIREQTRLEKTITQHERLLPFSRFSAKQINSALHKYSIRGKLSRQELTRAIEEIGLQLTHDVSDPNNDCYTFFNSLKDGFLYDANKIALCGILISSGTSQEKSHLFFEHYDTFHEKLLSKRVIKCMLKDIISMSVEYLPLLSLGNTVHNLSDQELEEFQDMLMVHRTQLINKLMIKLLEDREDIYMIEFVRKMSLDFTLSQMLWASCVRSLLLQESKYEQTT